MIYLAIPYSHSDPEVREQRFQMANIGAARLMGQGHHVFSPISHTHPIALAGDLPLGWDFWAEYDRQILSICNTVVVLCLDGWQESKGVQAEIALAGSMDIPVLYVLDTF
jgi:hypothetical protein